MFPDNPEINEMINILQCNPDNFQRSDFRKETSKLLEKNKRPTFKGNQTMPLVESKHQESPREQKSKK
jgi:hypothetical protein